MNPKSRDKLNLCDWYHKAFTCRWHEKWFRWEHSGSHILPFHTHVREDGFTETEKCAPGATGSDVFYL